MLGKKLTYAFTPRNEVMFVASILVDAILKGLGHKCYLRREAFSALLKISVAMLEKS